MADARRSWSELEGRLVSARAAAGSAQFRTAYAGSAADALDVGGLVVSGYLDVTDGVRVRATASTPESIAEGTYSELIQIGDTSYLSEGPLVDMGLFVAQRADLPGDAPLGSLYGGARLADPAAQLDGMADAITSFEALGPAEIGPDAATAGAETYGITLDSTLLEGPVVSGLPDGVLSGPIEARIAVDEDDLIQELELTLPVDGGESLTVTSTYLRWGYSVGGAVNPPLDDYVVTPEESAELLGSAP